MNVVTSTSDYRPTVYSVTTNNGVVTLGYTCHGLVDVIDTVESIFGTRYDTYELVADILAGMHHIARVDDVWVTVSPRYS